MNQDQGKDRALAVTENILKCIALTSPRVLPRGKANSGFTNGPTQIQRLTDSTTGTVQLLKGLLAKQLLIIQSQNQLLEKSTRTIDIQQLSINDLEAKNEKLLLEIEELKQNQISSKSYSVVVSRASSPFDSDVEPIFQQRGELRPELPTIHHRKYTIRRRLPQMETPMSPSAPYSESNQIGSEVKTKVLGNTEASTTSNLPRKTRSSSCPDDLVPFRDLTWKRKRLGSCHQKGELETESGETKGKKCKSVTTANGSEPNETPPSTSPRTHIHLQENYISSPDPEFLPSSLFREVGEQEVPEVEPGNIEVPSWRPKRIQPTNRSAGIEDLHDSTYSKRHWKAEEDEKRRKRWDAQKTREEEYVEQLKERLALRAKSRKKLNRGRARKTSEDAWDELPWIESFHPNPKEARFLQITDEIPLNVFGHLLPAFTQTEFSLPWQPVRPARPGMKMQLGAREGGSKQKK